MQPGRERYFPCPPYRACLQKADPRCSLRQRLKNLHKANGSRKPTLVAACAEDCLLQQRGKQAHDALEGTDGRRAFVAKIHIDLF